MLFWRWIGVIEKPLTICLEGSWGHEWPLVKLDLNGRSKQYSVLLSDRVCPASNQRMTRLDDLVSNQSNYFFASLLLLSIEHTIAMYISTKNIIHYNLVHLLDFSRDWLQANIWFWTYISIDKLKSSGGGSKVDLLIYHVKCIINMIEIVGCPCRVTIYCIIHKKCFYQPFHLHVMLWPS